MVTPFPILVCNFNFFFIFYSLTLDLQRKEKNPSKTLIPNLLDIRRYS